LHQAQKLEAIGTLAAGIAHDFNNILAAIMGYTEITKLRIEQPSLHGYLDHVLEACDRAKKLVYQILTFSRMTEQERKPVDISLIIKEALRLVRATLPSVIEIQENIAAGTHTVVADPTQLHQVFVNLCTNAAHAMRQTGGVLEICLENVEITAEMTLCKPDMSPGSYMKLSVRDTGGGIAPDVMDRIFEPFFTTKGKGEGTGLGLSVVYGIVKGCGGTITVESAPGTGAIFSVYIPAISDSRESKLKTSDALPVGKERILFVDDEEAIANMSREMLESLGYTVTTATNSLNALEMFRNSTGEFDLVITDMTMPGITGVDLSKEILKVRGDTPIILCSGFNELITEDKAKALGIRGFAMKPFNRKDIAVLIRKALEN
jgi:CheY-like chemotaxis protein